MDDEGMGPTPTVTKLRPHSESFLVQIKPPELDDQEGGKKYDEMIEELFSISLKTCMPL